MHSCIKKCTVSWSNIVCIETRLWAECFGFQILAGTGDLLVKKNSRPAVVPTEPGHVADHSCP